MKMKVPFYVFICILLFLFLLANMLLKWDFYDPYRNSLMVLQFFIIVIGLYDSNS
jgi:hypothetical protein